MRLLWRIALTAALVAVILHLTTSPVHEEAGTTRPITAGVDYAEIRIEDGPQEVRIVRVRRDEPGVRVDVGMADGMMTGLAPLSEIAQTSAAAGSAVMAAVNGDFFRVTGASQYAIVLGTTVAAGELIKTSRGEESFFVTDSGTAGIAVLDVAGQIACGQVQSPIVSVNNASTKAGVTLYTQAWGRAVDDAGVLCELSDGPLRSDGRWNARVVEAVPAGSARMPRRSELMICPHGSHRKHIGQLKPGAEVSIELSTAGLDSALRMAVGGNWQLLRAGRSVAPVRNINSRRHPRTAIGYNDDEIILLTCDGRQPDWSVGLYLDELAQLMLDIGCTDALNLDGGGSTTFWFGGKVANRPSDGFERSIANAVLVLAPGSQSTTTRP